jgi:hypothetical protein
VADRLDAAGLRSGAYDLGDDRVRLKLSIDALRADEWWTPAVDPPPIAPSLGRGPLVMDARSPALEAMDSELRRAPDAAFRASWP